MSVLFLSRPASATTQQRTRYIVFCNHHLSHRLSYSHTIERDIAKQSACLHLCTISFGMVAVTTPTIRHSLLLESYPSQSSPQAQS